MSDAKGLMPKEDAIAYIQASGLRPSVNIALFIASTSLHGQTTWDGEDYDPHYLRVAFNNTMSNAKRIVGILHDVVEDTDWTIDDLRLIGFEEHIIQGVDAVTKRPGEGYVEFIERCSKTKETLGELAIDVKMNDLKDNMDGSRTNGPMNDHQNKKQDMYKISYYYLLDVKKGNIEPGASVKDWMESHDGWKNRMDIYDYFSNKEADQAADHQAPEAEEPITP